MHLHRFEPLTFIAEANHLKNNTHCYELLAFQQSSFTFRRDHFKQTTYPRATLPGVEENLDDVRGLPDNEAVLMEQCSEES